MVLDNKARRRSISFSQPAWEAITDRFDADEMNVSATTSDTIERYMALLARERTTLRQRFSPADIAALADICKDTMFDANSAAYIEMEARDNLTPDIAAKWEVNRGDILTRLEATSIGGRYALVEAIERFRRRVGRGENPEAMKILDY